MTVNLMDQRNGVSNGTSSLHNGDHVGKQNGQNGAHSKIAADSLILTHPTPSEITTQSRLNGSSWRGALNIDAYLRREAYLATQGIAKDSGLTNWALCDKTQNGKKRDVLAGCETIRKRAIVNHNGKLQDVIVHAIGSVFTPPAFRGHGYGAVMMQKLAGELEHWQAEDLPCLFSILYSDIGKKFYAKNGGWRPFPSAHIHLRPEFAPGSNKLPEAKALYDDDLLALCADDEAMVRTRIAKRQQGTFVALFPDYATMSWHHARENFVSNELYGNSPTVKGAISRVGNDRIWCIFSRFWYNEDPKQCEGNTMYILRLVVENGESDNIDSELSAAHLAGIAAVLQYAQREAYQWNMGEIELWNPRQSTVEAAKLLDPKVKAVEREEESITSLRWYGPPDVEVDWLENEKYGWC